MKILLTILLVPTLALAQTGQAPPDRPHQAPSVKFLSAGAAQAAPLRYQLKRPQELTIVVGGEWKMSAPMGSSSSTFPVMTTPLRLTPGAKNTVEFTWLTPSFTGAPAGTRLETMTRLLLSGLDGSGGLVATDARGLINRFALHPGPNDSAVDAGSMQKRSLYALEMAKGMVSLLDVPLPEEAIGVGGRWQVERVAVRGSLSFVQVTTFTLEKRTGNVLELSYRFGGKWDPGSGFLESELTLAVSGGGKATVDLSLPMPTALEDQVEIDAKMRGRDGQSGAQSGVVRTHVESK